MAKLGFGIINAFAGILCAFAALREAFFPVRYRNIQSG
jgi:hypothetical protein